MRRWLTILVAALMTAALLPATAGGATGGAEGGTPGTAQNFELVGHEPLGGRGMNAAPAMYDHYVYVGNRTDGSSRCGLNDPRREETGTDSCPHPDPGVLIVDVADPSDPQVVGEIGPPEQGNPGETSRELRVWPEKQLLVVMNFQCSGFIHACAGSSSPELRFYDLSDPVNPERIASYQARQRNGALRTPHEMYLWVDPADPDRALMWLSLPTTSRNANNANLQIVDISDVPEGGDAVPVAEGNWNQLYEPMGNLALHSMTPTVDGKVTHLAYLSGLYLALDTAEVAGGNLPEGEVVSLNDNLLTQPEDRPSWDNPNPGHSAVPFPGRPFVLTTDEVYGTFTNPAYGCPWGWSRVINVGDLAQPEIMSEYLVRENTQAFCNSPDLDPEMDEANSFAAHNPTLTRNLALVTWHSAGLQAIDIRSPKKPTQAGWFSPTPLEEVANEDPALSAGPNKVVMWSFPIISDGLVYVTDVRNGLYVLRYTGPHAREVDEIEFLEGNSNLGDAFRIDHSARPVSAGRPDGVPPGHAAGRP